jgi:hypothetical protein
MQRSSFPWIWIGLAAILLLMPGAAGRLLLDLLGGITLLLILLPLLAAGAGFLGWQVIRRRLKTCATCGTTSFGSELCPACGTPLVPTQQGWRAEDPGMIDPSQMTINVEAVDVEPSVDSERKPSA